MTEKEKAKRRSLREPTAFKNKTLMEATSTDARRGRKPSIILYWRPVTKIQGYNVYRKGLFQSGKPRGPLNGATPIQQVKTKAALESIIPVNSLQWKQLQAAFTRATNQRPRFPRRPIDPGEAIEQGLTPEQDKAFEILALTDLKIRLARGLAYIDKNSTKDEWYIYELRGVRLNGSEIKLTENVKVQAGHYQLPDPPSAIKAIAGDRKVLVLWKRNPHAHGYYVSRAYTSAGIYYIINDQLILFNITTDLDNNPITPQPGFVDYQRWSEEGLPISHNVKGQVIEGPTNYFKYYYRVASIDIIGRIGNWSSEYLAVPTDKTPPMAPQEMSVNYHSTPPVGLELSWRKVTKDVQGHVELENLQTYKIYRSKKSEDLEHPDTLSSYFVDSITADPTDQNTMTLSWIDSDPSIFPLYGEEDIWYRICCEDIHNNLSAPSALISGRIPDTTPPGPTIIDGAEGNEKYIRIFWLPNNEPDLAGYQVYRSICDRGAPHKPKKQGEKYGNCDFALVGTIIAEEAKKRLDDVGRIYYDDYSVPEGSPLCYAYWVRAFDKCGNLYSTSDGCPRTQNEYVCQRLLEKTPPPVPLISKLQARNNSILIEWLGSPIQDLYAFHVYRSEKETDPPTFVACVLIDGTVLSEKWTGIEPHCSDIPSEPYPTAVKASLLDRKVEPNKIYWYRVSALDWLGNESEGQDLLKIPAVSTFTYDINLPIAPTVLPCPQTPTEGCGLVVSWVPPYDPHLINGFVVFRSLANKESYRQVSPIVRANKFNDKSAIKNTRYLYRVQAIDRKGQLSKPSPPVEYEY